MAKKNTDGQFLKDLKGMLNAKSRDISAKNMIKRMTTEKTHTDQQHIGRTDIDHMQRVTTWNTVKNRYEFASSSFTDQKTADTCQMLSLMVNAKSIEEWFQDKNRADKVIFKIKTNRPVGSGVIYQMDEKTGRQRFVAKDTDMVTMVLERDNKYGTHIVTCYPNIQESALPEKPVNLLKALKQTENYNKPGTWGSTKARWEQMCTIAGAPAVKKTFGPAAYAARNAKTFEKLETTKRPSMKPASARRTGSLEQFPGPAKTMTKTTQKEDALKKAQRAYTQNAIASAADELKQQGGEDRQIQYA